MSIFRSGSTTSFTLSIASTTTFLAIGCRNVHVFMPSPLCAILRASSMNSCSPGPKPPNLSPRA